MIEALTPFFISIIMFIVIVFLYFKTMIKRKKEFYKFLAELLKLKYFENRNYKLTGIRKGIGIEITDNFYFIKGKIRIKLSYAVRDNVRFYLRKAALSDSLYGINKYMDHLRKMIADPGSSGAMTAFFNGSLKKKINQLEGKVTELHITNNGIETALSNDFDTFLFIEIFDQILSIAHDINKDISFKDRLLNNIENEEIYNDTVDNIKEYIKCFDIDAKLIRSVKKIFKSNPFIGSQIEIAGLLKREGMPHLMSLLKDGRENELNTENLISVIRLFKNNNYSQSIDKLIDIYNTSVLDDIKIEILEAFKEFKSGTLSGFLTGILDENKAGVKIKVIEALGACGNLDAVEKLYPYKKSLNIFYRQAAENAIEGIQKRSAGSDAGKGMLSSVNIAGSEGALSAVKDHDEGRLSIEGGE